MWRPPKGWDAASNESNNKIIVKAPAKNTQKRAHFINLQTTRRDFENNIIKNALQQWNIKSSSNESLSKKRMISFICGATFEMRKKALKAVKKIALKRTGSGKDSQA